MMCDGHFCPFHSGNAHKGLLEVAGLQDPESSARDGRQLLQF